MKLGLNLIIYSVYSWFSLVLDLGNLPIKLGLPMFLNRRRYSTLFMPVSMSIFCIASLVHSLFSTNLALNHDYTNGGNAVWAKYEIYQKHSYKLGNWHKLGTCIMACSQKCKLDKFDMNYKMCNLNLVLTCKSSIYMNSELE